MDDFLAVTIGVGPKYRRMAELAGESYERQGGGRWEILHDGHLEESGLKVPGQLKFRLFDFFPEAKRILYFDSDMVFLRRMDLARFASGEPIYCVRDGDEKPWVRQDAGRIGMPPGDYFNSGFMVLSAKHHREYLRLADLLTPLSEGMFNDQSQLNWAAELCGIRREYLPRAYNHIGFYKEDWSETILGHFIGFNVRDRSVEELEALYYEWMGRVER